MTRIQSLERELSNLQTDSKNLQRLVRTHKVYPPELPPPGSFKLSDGYYSPLAELPLLALGKCELLRKATITELIREYLKARK